MTVQRKGLHCTHVDALRFFAPEARSWNHHGALLDRRDQLRFEQPACVHANMDLLKIVLRLQPFCDAKLIQRVLEIVLQARRLDIAASPYDVSEYLMQDQSMHNDHAIATVIPIETAEGREMYRQKQIALMKQAESIRRDLLQAYNDFLKLAFDEEALSSPRAKQFA